MVQSTSKVVIPFSSEAMVGSAIRTILESSDDMRVPRVVLLSTVHLYSIQTILLQAF
jgi:hypothetical protein